MNNIMYFHFHLKQTIHMNNYVFPFSQANNSHDTCMNNIIYFHFQKQTIHMMNNIISFSQAKPFTCMNNIMYFHCLHIRYYPTLIYNAVLQNFKYSKMSYIFQLCLKFQLIICGKASKHQCNKTKTLQTD